MKLRPVKYARNYSRPVIEETESESADVHSDGLYWRYKHIVVFDVETTGINSNTNEIIEFAGVAASCAGGELEIVKDDSFLIRLADGTKVPPFIVENTGITDDMLDLYGISQRQSQRSGQQYALC